MFQDHEKETEEENTNPLDLEVGPVTKAVEEEG